jgi:hypothetical protein
VLRLLRSIQLPPNWREEVVAALHPKLDADAIREQEEATQARLERAKRLYIDGDIDETRYGREKLECQARLTDLRPGNYCDMLLAAKPTEACYALIQHSVGFRPPYLYGMDCRNNGSDGPCTPSDKIVILPPDEAPPGLQIG